MQRKCQIGMVIFLWGFIPGCVVYATESAEAPPMKDINPITDTEANGEADLARHNIGETVVTANRRERGFATHTGNVGILGERNTMDTPFTVTNITQASIQDFGDPSQPLDSILAQSPAIRQSGSVLHNDFTFRGFRANGTSTYVNGIPGIWTQFNAPTYVMERAEVVAGPNSGLSGTGTQYESDTAGGLVNFVTKRAGRQDFNRLIMTYGGHGMLGTYLDLSRRLGGARDWGLRVMTEYVNGNTAVDKEKIKSRSIFMNLDHRDKKSTTNFFAGYRDHEVLNGQRWFKLGANVTHMPSPPNPSRNYSFDGMEKESYGYVMTVNHEQNLSSRWKWFTNFGMMHNKLNKNIMYQNSALTIFDDDGDFQLIEQSSTTPQVAYYWQLGMRGKLPAGVVDHSLTFAFDRAWRLREGTKGGTMARALDLGTGNIYSGTMHQTRAVDSSYESYLSNKTRMEGFSLADMVSYQKWQFLLGFHHHDAYVDAYSSNTGRVSSSMHTSANTPTYALMYHPEKNLAIYVSHSENFNTGTVVGSGYKNQGDILPPAKTKQNELGVKWMNKNLLTTLALFDIEQANNIDVYRENNRYQFQDGKLRHKGVELSITGNPARKWQISTGISYLDAKYEKTARVLHDDILESGRPHWAGSLLLRYDAEANFGVFARVLYTGSAPLLYERFYAPAYTTLDVGLNWNTKIRTMPAKVSLVCYNAFNKSYWNIARGDNLYLSTPRTFALTVCMDF